MRDNRQHRGVVGLILKLFLLGLFALFLGVVGTLVAGFAGFPMVEDVYYIDRKSGKKAHQSRCFFGLWNNWEETDTEVSVLLGPQGWLSATPDWKITGLSQQPIGIHAEFPFTYAPLEMNDLIRTWREVRFTDLAKRESAHRLLLSWNLPGLDRPDESYIMELKRRRRNWTSNDTLVDVNDLPAADTPFKLGDR